MLTMMLPDEDDTQDEHPGRGLAERLRALGVQALPRDLKGLPYEVVFSERLRARIVADG